MKKIFWVIIIILLIMSDVVLYKLNQEKKANTIQNDSSTNQSLDAALKSIDSTYTVSFIAIAVIIIALMVLFLIKRQF